MKNSLNFTILPLTLVALCNSSAKAASFGDLGNGIQPDGNKDNQIPLMQQNSDPMMFNMMPQHHQNSGPSGPMVFISQNSGNPKDLSSYIASHKEILNNITDGSQMGFTPKGYLEVLGLLMKEKINPDQIQDIVTLIDISTPQSFSERARIITDAVSEFQVLKINGDLDFLFAGDLADGDKKALFNWYKTPLKRNLFNTLRQEHGFDGIPHSGLSYRSIVDQLNAGINPAIFHQIAELIDLSLPEDLMLMTLENARAKAINDVWTNYSVIPPSLLHCSESEQIQMYHWWMDPSQQNAALFAEMNKVGLLSNIASNQQLTSLQLRQLVDHSAKAGISPAQIKELHLNKSILSKQTLGTRLEYPQLEIENKLSIALKDSVMLPAISESPLSEEDHGELLSFVLQSGIAAFQIKAAQNYMKPEKLQSISDLKKKAKYIAFISKAAEVFEKKGLFAPIQNLGNQTPLSNDDKQTLLNSLSRSSIEDLANIPVGDLSQHQELQQRISYINLALELNKKQPLYQAYGSLDIPDDATKGMLINQLVNDGNVTPDKVAGISLETMESFSSLQLLSEDSGSNSRRDSILMFANYVMGSTSDKNAIISAIDGGTDDGFFDNQYHISAYEYLNDKSAFLGVDFESSKQLISNFVSLSTWNDRLLMFSTFSGEEFLTALAWALDPNNQDLYHRAYLDGVAYGFSTMGDLESSLELYTQLDEWINRSAALEMMKSSEDKKSLLSWVSGDVMNQNTFDSASLSGVLLGLDTWSDLSDSLNKYNNLTSWQEFSSTISQMKKPEDKKSFFQWTSSGDQSILNGATQEGFISDVDNWNDLFQALNSYQALNGWENLSSALSLVTSNQDKRSLLSWCAADSSNQNAFDSANLEGLIDPSMPWGSEKDGKMLDILTQYSIVMNAGEDTLRVLFLGTSAPEQKYNALSWYTKNDSTNGKALSALNDAGVFENVMGLDMTVIGPQENGYQLFVNGLSNTGLSSADLDKIPLVASALDTSKSDYMFDRFQRIEIAYLVTSKNLSDGLSDGSSAKDFSNALFDLSRTTPSSNILSVALDSIDTTIPQTLPERIKSIQMSIISMMLSQKLKSGTSTDLASALTASSLTPAQISSVAQFVDISSEDTVENRVAKVVALQKDVSKVGADIGALTLGIMDPAVFRSSVSWYNQAPNGLIFNALNSYVGNGVKPAAGNDAVSGGVQPIPVNGPADNGVKPAAGNDAVSGGVQPIPVNGPADKGVKPAAGNDAVGGGVQPSIDNGAGGGVQPAVGSNGTPPSGAPSMQMGVFFNNLIFTILGKAPGLEYQALVNKLAQLSTVQGQGGSVFITPDQIAAIGKYIDTPQESASDRAQRINTLSTNFTLATKNKDLDLLTLGLSSPADLNDILAWYSGGKATFFNTLNSNGLFKKLIPQEGSPDLNGRDYQNMVKDLNSVPVADLLAVLPLIDTVSESIDARIRRVQLALALGVQTVALASGQKASDMVGAFMNSSLQPSDISSAKGLVTNLATDKALDRANRLMMASFINGTPALLEKQSPAASLLARDVINALIPLPAGLTVSALMEGINYVDTNTADTAAVRANRIMVAAAVGLSMSPPPVDGAAINDLTNKMTGSPKDLVNALLSGTAATGAQVLNLMPLVDTTASQTAVERSTSLKNLLSIYNMAGPANVVAIMTLADNPSARSALLTGFGSDSNKAKFLDAFNAGLFNGMPSQSSWGSNIGNVLSSYVAVGTDAPVLVAFANTFDDRKALLSGYAGEAKAKTLFAPIAAAGLLNDWGAKKDGVKSATWTTPLDISANGATASETISELIAQYNILSSLQSPWLTTTPASTVATSISKFLSNLTSPLDKRLALKWAQTNANRTLFDAANKDGLVNGLTIWGDGITDGNMLNVLNQYNTLKTLSPSWSNFSSMLGKMPLSKNKREALAYFNDGLSGQARRAAYDALASDLGNWADIQTYIDKYTSVPTWTNFAPMLVKLTVAGDKKAALDYFSDGTNGEARRTGYDLIASDLTKMNDIKTSVDQYLSLPTWSGASAFLTPITAASDKRSALAWAQTPANQAIFEAAKTAGVVDGVTVWGTSSSGQLLNVLTQYNTLNTLSPAWSNFSPLLTSLSTPADKRLALTWAQTPANRTLFDVSKTAGVLGDLTVWGTATSSQMLNVLTQYNTLNTLSPAWNNFSPLLTSLATPSDKRLALTWAQTPANRTLFNTAKTAGVLDGLTVWGTATSSQMLNVLTQYNTLNTLTPAWSLSGALGKVTAASDKRLALTYFSDSASGSLRRTAYTNAANVLGISFTTWSGTNSLSEFLNSYSIATTSATTASISNLNTVLSAGLTLAADKSLALTWYTAGNNKAILDASFLIKGTSPKTLFTSISDLTTVTSTKNGYQRFVDQLVLKGATAAQITVTKLTTTVVNTLTATSQTAILRADAVKAKL